MGKPQARTSTAAAPNHTRYVVTSYYLFSSQQLAVSLIRHFLRGIFGLI